MADRGCWVYAVTDRYPARDLSCLTGVAGAAVRAAAAAGLTALVSDVDLTEFGAEPLRRNLEDLAWLERIARAHHHVVDTLWGLASVLPMRLATVYTSKVAMAAALAARQAELEDALTRVRGRVEWGVKAYPLTLTPDDDPATAGPASRGGDGAGLAYLKRRRDQLTARQRSWQDAVRSARSVHGELRRPAAEARLHPPQSPRLSGNRAAMVLNASYLVGQDSQPVFTSAVAEAAARHRGLRLELTGPWPPYSFAGGHACDPE
jgi:Gas vesicle synthesis protein GvpL/GvpF